MSYVISCSSTCDLSNEHLKKRNVEYISFHYQMDGKSELDDLGASLSMEDFYTAMENGAETRTSQINEDEYVSFFEKFLKEGKDVLHVDLSSGISGTVNSARLAKEALEEKYPDRALRNWRSGRKSIN